MLVLNWLFHGSARRGGHRHGQWLRHSHHLIDVFQIHGSATREPASTGIERWTAKKERLKGDSLRKAAFVLILVGALSVTAMPFAQALTSFGLSADCDSDGHCVSGTAMSSNAGVNASTLPEVSVDVDELGAAIALCKGSGTGATLIQITCSIGQQSQTMSFPGSVGAVPLATTTDKLDRLPVCWDVTGFFPTIFGAEHRVSTGGCALLGV